MMASALCLPLYPAALLKEECPSSTPDTTTRRKLDKSRILVTVRETNSGRVHQREVGVLSEFNTNGIDARERFIQEWITERAEPQHNTTLSLVEWRYLNDSEWLSFYG